MSEVLLANHPLFTDHWVNDEAFVFEDISYEDIPEEVFIPLITENGTFKVNWYGKVNSSYKKRWGRYHQGIDLQLHTGDGIYAAFDGVVRYAQYNRSGYGNCVIIRHLNGLETIYGHLSKIQVKPNEYVNAGDIIGLGGSTGHSFGPHLHFETRYKDFSFDPELIFNFDNQTLKTENLILEKKQFLAYHYHASRRSHKTRKAAEESLPAIADSTEQPIDLIEVVSGDESDPIASDKYYPAPEKVVAKKSTSAKKTVVTRKRSTSKSTGKKTVAKNKKTVTSKSAFKKGTTEKSAKSSKKKNTVTPKKKSAKKPAATTGKKKGKKASAGTAKKVKKRK